MQIDRRTFIATSVAGAASLASLRGGGSVPAGGGAFADMAGVYTALFTPYTKDNRINDVMIGKMIEYALANGIRGFYLTGGTGEGLLLSKEERKQVYRAAAKAAKGRAKLIAHVGCVNTDDAVELARAAAAMRYIGLDCGMFRPPHEPYTEAEYADFCAKADELGIFRRNQAI
jgi:N-acetylneuraminate lyase